MKKAREEEKLSWQDRLALAGRGLSAYPERTAAAVRRLMDMPLEEYLPADPQLRQRLQRLWSPAPRTFQDAAAVLKELMESKDQSRVMEGEELLLRFAAPLIDR